MLSWLLHKIATVAFFCGNNVCLLLLGIADGNGLLSLLAELFASLGKLAHRELRHGQALQAKASQCDKT